MSHSFKSEWDLSVFYSRFYVYDDVITASRSSSIAAAAAVQTYNIASVISVISAISATLSSTQINKITSRPAVLTNTYLI